MPRSVSSSLVLGEQSASQTRNKAEAVAALLQGRSDAVCGVEGRRNWEAICGPRHWY